MHFRIEELDVQEQTYTPPRAPKHNGPSSHWHAPLVTSALRQSGSNLMSNLGRWLYIFYRASVFCHFCVIYCLTTECRELHPPIVERAVLSMGEDVVNHRTNMNSRLQARDKSEDAPSCLCSYSMIDNKVGVKPDCGISIQPAGRAYILLHWGSFDKPEFSGSRRRTCPVTGAL